MPGVAEARQGDTGGDEPQRKATPQDAVDSIHTAALSGSSGEGINTAQAQVMVFLPLSCLSKLKFLSAPLPLALSYASLLCML